MNAESVKLLGEYEELCVVPHTEVHARTLEGWKLLQALAEDVTVPIFTTKAQWVPQDNESGRYQSGFETYDARHETVARQAMFVMGLKRDDVVTNLRDELKQAHAERLESAEEEERVKKNCNDQEQVLKSTKDALEGCNNRLLEAQQERADAREATRKMEKDLAKVRQVIGDRQFKEILGE